MRVVLWLLITVLAAHHLAMSAMPGADAMPMRTAPAVASAPVPHETVASQLSCEGSAPACPLLEGAHLAQRTANPDLPPTLAYPASAAAQLMRAALHLRSPEQVRPDTRRAIPQVLRI
jgi:hypothetical protein